jgi:hypothetical protein
LKKVKLPHIDTRLTGDMTDFLAEHPNHERLAAVRKESKVCLGFVTWLKVNGCVILPPKGETLDLYRILCHFFGVSPEELAKEKQSMVAKVKGITVNGKA